MRYSITLLLLITIFTLNGFSSGAIHKQHAVYDAKAETNVTSLTCTPVETLEYGVKGDGVTDDTIALDNALAYEDTVCLSKRYKINGTLTIDRDNLLIHGGGVLFRKTQKSGAMLTITGKNITVRDIKFNGKNKIPQGITVEEHSANITFDNINMHNFFAHSHDGGAFVLSIAGDFCNNIQIKNSTFSNLNATMDGETGNTQGAVRAIYLYSNNSGSTSSKIIIKNNTFKDIQQLEDGDAIHFQGKIVKSTKPFPSFEGSAIQNNTFINCVKRAIKIQASHILIENNTIKATEKILTPIELFGDHNIVRNNTIDVEHAISGITVKGDENSIENNRITISKTNQYFQYNGGSIYGLINLGDNNIFRKNTVTTWGYGYMERKNSEHGVLKNLMVDNTIIESNKFNNCQLTFTDTRGLTFKNNKITGQGKSKQSYGLYYSSPQNTNFNINEIIQNNTIRDVKTGVILKYTNELNKNHVQSNNNFYSVNDKVVNW